jgi:hypothetical protein
MASFQGVSAIRPWLSNHLYFGFNLDFLLCLTYHTVNNIMYAVSKKHYSLKFIIYILFVLPLDAYLVIGLKIIGAVYKIPVF